MANGMTYQSQTYQERRAKYGENNFYNRDNEYNYKR